MEPLWSPVVATIGNLWQIAQAREPRNQAKTVAVDCDRAPEKFHGKEGVDGSSPSEGSAKCQHKATFYFRISLQMRERGTGMELFIELPGRENSACGRAVREPA